MAFSFNYLSKISQSQDLDASYNPSTGLVGAKVPNHFSYNASATGSNESAATVNAANYFLTAYASLKPGDTIYVYSNDPQYSLRAVATSTVAGVTTAATI